MSAPKNLHQSYFTYLRVDHRHWLVDIVNEQLLADRMLLPHHQAKLLPPLPVMVAKLAVAVVIARGPPIFNTQLMLAETAQLRATYRCVRPNSYFNLRIPSTFRLDNLDRAIIFSLSLVLRGCHISVRLSNVIFR